jgi:3-oxoacyl-[acyl-carrier protein] reductase
MDLKLQGTPVLITGGSRGVGRALAVAFGREGAQIAICGRDEQGLAATADEVRRTGAQCLAIRADLSTGQECERVVNTVADQFGGLGVLVNNASNSVDKVPASLEGIDDEQVLQRVNGKVMAAVRCSRAAIPYLKQASHGRIINIGGTSARNVFRAGELPGSGSAMPQGLGNAALANFSKYLAEELVSGGVMVNIVHPHLIRTDRHPGRVRAKALELGITEEEAERVIAQRIPLGRLVEVDDVASLVLFLSSPLAGAITGQSIAVDCGASSSIYY